jgi:XRE family aerobic/anaerobic benzoate catabolism transcriptional regulator
MRSRTGSACRSPACCRSISTRRGGAAPLPQVEAILHLLDNTRGPVAEGKRGRRLALIGLRGAGKSTLGAALAGRLGCPFIELDKMIESHYGAPAAMLIEVYGPAAFRRYERDRLEKVIALYPEAVIATAGGIVAEEATFARLLARTHVVWLRASPADHMRRVMEQGDFRPMAANQEAMADLVAILDAREPDYGRAAAQLMTSGKSIEDCVEALRGIAAELFGGRRRR